MKNYPFPISQLDTLARYLINNHGDIVKTDDLSLETVVDEAIKVMETLSSQQAVEDGQAGIEPGCDCNNPDECML